MKKHVMLDLETLDTKPSALVLSIGVAVFDADTFEVVDTYYVALERSLQRHLGRTESAETLAWWDAQSLDARKVFTHPRVEVADALSHLDGVLCDVQGLWGNGADFDCVILGSLYESFSRRKPWSYSKNRCLRTLKNVLLPKTYVKPERLGTRHDALDDAMHQVTQLQAICAATGIRF